MLYFVKQIACGGKIDQEPLIHRLANDTLKCHNYQFYCFNNHTTTYNRIHVLPKPNINIENITLRI